jgi:3',5'-nucleoside bisphosphate phosphatase
MIGWILLALGICHATEHPREISFPKTKSGYLVLSVDPHTHSVFSDGLVWPKVRVWEANKDNLDAWVVTEHLEYQPHKDDIPHPDRNRAFEIAKKETAKNKKGALVIPGAEITRDFPPGHMNAIFIKDANALLVDNAKKSIQIANKQGAFVFWNHSWWPKDFPNGVVTMSNYHEKLIKEGLMDGIEIANGPYYSDEAYQIALDYNLAVIGASDIHGLIDYDYDVENGEQRTVTLVLATERSQSAIQKGFEEHRTAVLYRHNIMGREAEVRDIIEGSLTLIKGDYIKPEWSILPVTIENHSSTPITLKNISNKGFNSQSNQFTVPANSSIRFDVSDVVEKEKLILEFEVLNAYIAPRTNLQITLY